jgi:hypothetical protein
MDCKYTVALKGGHLSSQTSSENSRVLITVVEKRYRECFAKIGAKPRSSQNPLQYKFHEHFLLEPSSVKCLRKKSHTEYREVFFDTEDNHLLCTTTPQCWLRFRSQPNQNSGKWSLKHQVCHLFIDDNHFRLKIKMACWFTGKKRRYPK